MATYSQVCSNVGSFTYGNRFTLYVVLTNRDGDPATNKSWVDYNVYFENTSGGGTFTSQTRLYFALNGTGIKDTTSSITGPRNGRVSIASGSTQIEHNSDGTKSISYHALVKSSSFGISGELSGTFTLTTIPRASSITCSTANIGSNPTITITSASTSFVHNVYGAFGSLNFSVFSNVKGGTYTSWTIPTDFYSQIPNSRTGKGTLYCQTYSGSTLVGTTSVQLNVTTSESACRPTVTGTVVDTNATTIALTGNKNKLVLGKSTAQITVTPVAKNSATIKSVTIDGVATTNNTRTIAKVSKISFPIAVTDSREYPSAAYSVIASGGSVPYEDLSFNATIFRPQPTGTEIQMKYSGKYYNGSFGAVANTLSITWKYKVKGATSWTNGGTITPTLSGNTISVKTISLGTSYNYQTAYEFQIVAVDKLTTITQTIPLSVGMPVFYWGKDFFNVVKDLKITSNIIKENRIAKLPQGWLNSGKSFNDALTTGIYDVDHSALNGPFQTWGYLDVQVANGDTWNKSTNWIWQTFYQTGGAIYQRAALNSSSFTSWQRIYKETVLYNNSSGNNGTVTLSESSDNFDYLEIFFTNNNKNKYNSVKVFSPNGKNVDLHIIGGWNNGTNGSTDIRTKTVSISGTSITNANINNTVEYSFLEINGGSIRTHESINYIYITKVIGYR